MTTPKLLESAEQAELYLLIAWAEGEMVAAVADGER